MIDVEKMAKVELHCHLDGSLSLEVIRQLADLAQISLPEDDDTLKTLVTAPETCESLMDYLKTFDFIRPLLQTPEALELAAYDVMKQAAADQVIYIEIRFAPELSMDQGLTAIEVVEAVLAGIQKGQEEFGVIGKAIVCGIRQSSQETSQAIFEHVVSLAQKGLVGFDFAGNELDFPPSVLESVICKTQALGLPFTLHAGECGCPNYISDAIDLGIKRLGHVTAIHRQKALLTKFIENGVTAELCLTSNLQTKAAKSLEDFPYLEMKAARAKVSINTDNRTVSDTNLNQEYRLFIKHFKTSAADFFLHNQDAIQASFASSAEKEELLSHLEKSYRAYL
ncbi:adenosine deaminase [Streptococcus castoreus]|uniref:adenosine deaminase n=1 Tax=Streptococcus castoreus TaxID=254786 RepID=UPI003CC63657